MEPRLVSAYSSLKFVLIISLPTTNISATMIVMIVYRMIEVGIVAGMKIWNPGW